MKKYAVIVAAGSGSRMGSPVPKQFLQLDDKAVLYYTIMAFANAYDDMQIILVLPDVHFDRGLQIVQQTTAANRVQIVAGGATRFASVGNGLDLVKDESIVFVHDGVRCMVGRQLIERCYHQAMAKGSAIPAVTATDSIRLVKGDTNEPIDRSTVRIIQTPQTFQSGILLNAFQQPEQPSFTDEASVVETMGQPVFLIDGDYDNIKITRPADLIIAREILQERSALK